jgi:putative phage-type endonuclease
MPRLHGQSICERSGVFKVSELQLHDSSSQESDTSLKRQEWLKWRHEGIGSSDASIIMGVSRFKDWETLLSEKAGPMPPEDNRNAYIKDRGNKIEFQVRMFFEKLKGQTYAPQNCVNSVFPFIRASLDGYSEDHKSIIEIKLLSSVNPDKINTEAEGYKKWLAAREGTVPKEYYPQLQHQLFVTGAEVCFFVGYKEVKGNQIVTEDKLAVIPVYPDKVYQRKLLQEEFRFWLEVQYRKQELEYKNELE